MGSGPLKASPELPAVLLGRSAELPRQEDKYSTIGKDLSILKHVKNLQQGVPWFQENPIVITKAAKRGEPTQTNRCFRALGPKLGQEPHPT